MSYSFPNANSVFFGDAGAGNEKTMPKFILAFAKVPTGNFASTSYAAGLSNTTDTAVLTGGHSIYVRGTTAPDGRAGGVAFDNTSGSGLGTPTFTAATYEGVWTGFGIKAATASSRTGYWNSTATSATNTTALTITDLFRSVRVGGGSTAQVFGSTNKLAEVVFGFFAPTDTELNDYFSGTIATEAFAGKDFWYYPLNTNATSHADASGNGGPTITAAGAVSYDADHPTITSSARYIPTVSPLYYGATLLANKTNITYKVTLGHTNLVGSTIGSGVDGTTDASGNFVLPAAQSLTDDGNVPALNDAVTLHLYWEEGSSPVVDRSLIVKTTLAEEV